MHLIARHHGEIARARRVGTGAAGRLATGPFVSPVAEPNAATPIAATELAGARKTFSYLSRRRRAGFGAKGGFSPV
jgi:hypothetical protein